jgi:hypothetical protein
MQLVRMTTPELSPTRGLYWIWPTGSSDDKSRPTEDPCRASIPLRPSAPPRQQQRPSQPPIWIHLEEKHKTQLLEVLKRMLTDRLAAEAQSQGGGHERC